MLSEGPRSRRLQRMGAVTIGVSLPREWVGEHRLKVGSPVYLEPLSDGSILVRDRAAPNPSETARIEVRHGSPREHLFRRLVAAYLDGAEGFEVHEPGGLSIETRAIVRTFAMRTIRPEIVSEDAERLVLREVSRGSELELEPLLRRMHQLVSGLQQEASDTLAGAGEGASGGWTLRDDEIDRHAWLIERILALRAATPAGGSEIPLGSLPQALLLVRALERTADHAVLIAEHGAGWSGTSPPVALVRAVTDFYREARQLCSDAFATALARDAGAANDLLDTAEALHAQYRTLLESILDRRGESAPPVPGRVELALLLQSIDRTVAYAQDIAETGLDAGVRASLGESSVPPFRSSTIVEKGGQREK